SRETSTWTLLRLTESTTSATPESCEVTECLEARQEKVRTTTNRRECRQALDRLADRPFRNLEFQCAVLVADDRVALVAEFVKVAVVRPHVLGKLVLPDETGAPNEGCNAPFDAIFRRALRQRWSVGSAAANHPAAIHVGRGV